MERKEKLNLAIIFGGKSVEHEVSVESARNVYNALDKNRYQPVLIFINKSGGWNQVHPSFFSERDSYPIHININKTMTIEPFKEIDIAFPVLHGPIGEDGTIQGLLKLTHIPFVGSDILGSALAMDKEVSKRLFKDANLPIGRYVTLRAPETIDFSSVEKQLGQPFFVKPANCGSSVGVSKVINETQLAVALNTAFSYDTKVILEEFIDGREIECSVLGNDQLQVSLPGEIIPHDDFYSYNAKYTNEEGAQLIVPVELEPKITEKIQQIALTAFKTLECQGMARVDFFLKKDGQLILNEVNTIPGFTHISMYPKLWEASGLKYPQLIDKLIELAIERFENQEKLETSYNLS